MKQKDLSHLSDAIQQEQTRLFHESQLAKNILHATFDSRDRFEIKKIWRAVEFTEALVNPGITTVIMYMLLMILLYITNRYPSSSFKIINADIFEPYAFRSTKVTI